MAGRIPPAPTAVGPATQEALTPFIGSTSSSEIAGILQPRPDDAKSQATRGALLRDVVAVEHPAAISPCLDIGDSWPDEGGGARRSAGSMEVGHTVYSPT